VAGLNFLTIKTGFMKTSNIIAVCIIASAALTISQSSSAQIRLGAASATHLSSAASLNAPSVSNALRASAATSVSAASRVKASGATAGRQIEGKTTTAVKQTVNAERQTESESAKGSSANVEVKSATTASVQKQ
jgi:hypothetical protein